MADSTPPVSRRPSRQKSSSSSAASTGAPRRLAPRAHLAILPRHPPRQLPGKPIEHNLMAIAVTHEGTVLAVRNAIPWMYTHAIAIPSSTPSEVETVDIIGRRAQDTVFVMLERFAMDANVLNVPRLAVGVARGLVRVSGAYMTIPVVFMMDACTGASSYATGVGIMVPRTLGEEPDVFKMYAESQPHHAIDAILTVGHLEEQTSIYHATRAAYGALVHHGASQG